jgi:DNA-directed RNA polymerase specialized sigma24 family protein
MSKRPTRAASLRQLRYTTRRLASLQDQQREVAELRRTAVAELQEHGLSLQDIATELGVTKGAVQKMAR